MGAVIDGKMRLFLEEDKIPGAKNATFYPDNIYEFANTAKEGDQWYLHRSYKKSLILPSITAPIKPSPIWPKIALPSFSAKKINVACNKDNQ